MQTGVIQRNCSNASERRHETSSVSRQSWERSVVVQIDEAGRSSALDQWHAEDGTDLVQANTRDVSQSDIRLRVCRQDWGTAQHLREQCL